MAQREQHKNRETKKPKKEKPKSVAAAPSTKGQVSGAFHSATETKR